MTIIEQENVKRARVARWSKRALAAMGLVAAGVVTFVGVVIAWSDARFEGNWMPVLIGPGLVVALVDAVLVSGAVRLLREAAGPTQAGAKDAPSVLAPFATPQRSRPSKGARLPSNPFRKKQSLWRWIVDGVAASFLLSIAGALVMFILVPMVYRPAPARAHWEQSRPAFQAAVDAYMAQPAATDDWATVKQIGGYDIRGIMRTDHGVLFYDTEGCGFLDDAGFAYMPEGVIDHVGESPKYRKLSPNWYSFCASW